MSFCTHAHVAFHADFSRPLGIYLASEGPPFVGDAAKKEDVTQVKVYHAKKLRL